jgi:hypothetical protein
LNRRELLRTAAAAALCRSSLGAWPSPLRAETSPSPVARIRPGDAGWPSEASWDRLRQAVSGRLIKVTSPLAECAKAASSTDCEPLFKKLKNPYFLRDEAGLTQTLGWVGAWTSAPSAYAVAAESTADVVAAVNFARENNLRLVVKGGGHSYQGTSNAPDSLLVWMRRMTAITIHDAFVGAGCEAQAEPQPAVTVEAGAIWGEVYDKVTTGSGRFVQGGGCLTVGVAGLVQSGGFGIFSKRYGTAAASLLEAEIVTADGQVRTANACTNPDLFWALKGGGGGSFGVVTRLTLRTHGLPEFFGGAFVTVKATSEAAFHRLIEAMLRFYSEALFNPHWGEQIALRPSNVMTISMISQGLSKPEAEGLWWPFLDWIAASPADFSIAEPPNIFATPARQFWNPAFLKKLPGVVLTDDRPDAPDSNIFWASNRSEAGQVLHGYQSAWLPARLLQDDKRGDLVEALFAASRHWGISLHIIRGLPARPKPRWLRRATLQRIRRFWAPSLCSSAAPRSSRPIPPFPATSRMRRRREAMRRRSRRLWPRSATGLAPEAPISRKAITSRMNGRTPSGARTTAVCAVKAKYDPDGLFIVHHGVGSEGWSADGFTRTG